MKNFLSLFIFIFMLFQLVTAEARQVHVLSEKVQFTGKIDDTQRKSIILQNTSNEKKEYIMKFMRGEIGDRKSVV